MILALDAKNICPYFYTLSGSTLYKSFANTIQVNSILENVYKSRFKSFTSAEKYLKSQEISI